MRYCLILNYLKEFNLNPEQKFLLENLYKGFIRNGANLNQQDQDTLKVLNKKLSVLTVKFSQNVLAETNNYVMYVNKEYLTGIGLIPQILPRYRSTYFLHIAGGYDSGYYSYIWAAVYDNDAFEAFKEKGIFDKSVAESYRKNILEKNGTMDAMQMYLNFRGRAAVIEPLLRNRGLLQNTELKN